MLADGCGLSIAGVSSIAETECIGRKAGGCGTGRAGGMQQWCSPLHAAVAYPVGGWIRLVYIPTCTVGLSGPVFWLEASPLSSAHVVFGGYR